MDVVLSIVEFDHRLRAHDTSGMQDARWWRQVVREMEKDGRWKLVEKEMNYDSEKGSIVMCSLEFGNMERTFVMCM